MNAGEESETFPLLFRWFEDRVYYEDKEARVGCVKL